MHGCWSRRGAGVEIDAVHVDVLATVWLAFALPRYCSRDCPGSLSLRLRWWPNSIHCTLRGSIFYARYNLAEYIRVNTPYGRRMLFSLTRLSGGGGGLCVGRLSFVFRPPLPFCWVLPLGLIVGCLLGSSKCDMREALLTDVGKYFPL